MAKRLGVLQSGPRWNWIAVMVVLLAATIGLIYGLYRVSAAVAKDQMVGAIVAAAIVAGVGLVGSIYNQWAMADRERWTALREKKREAYVRFLRTYFEDLPAAGIEDENKRKEALERTAVARMSAIAEML